MTFKMLIVDDEPIICRGLASTIPWKDLDVEVVDIAHDGDEAIAKVEKFDGVDIVMTDVRMPNKDGLQLAAYLSKNYPQTKVIMISGYDEFSYAKRAIQLGVKDYLLKPVDIEELLKGVRKVIKEIREAQVESEQFEQTNLMTAVYQQVFNQHRETGELEKLESSKTVFPFFMMAKNYLKLTRDMGQEEVNSFKSEWKSAVEDYFLGEQITSVSIFTSENMLFTCLFDDRKQLTSSELRSAAKNLDDENRFLFLFNENGNLLKNLSSTVNLLSEKVSDLPVSDDGVMCSGQLVDNHGRVLSLPKEIENSLIQAVVQCQQSEIADSTSQLFAYLRGKQCSLGEATSLCTEMIDKVLEQLKALLQKETHSTTLQFHQSIDVLYVTSFERLQELFEEDIETIIGQFKLKAVDDKDWLIERALEYINSYYKKEIRAQEVADVINISPNYFSSLFKRNTGKSFNEYLNELRVKEAKTLLIETPFKVSEISEQVGFNEYKYFVEVFKRYTGTTPTKFRKLTT